MNLRTIQAAYRQRGLDKHQYIEKMYEAHAQLMSYAELLPDTSISSIEIQDGQVLATCRATGVRVEINLKDRRTAPLEILNFGNYEGAEFEMMLRLIPIGATVFDIGANIGWHALRLARLVPSSRVLGFEPIPETFAQLARNVARNPNCAVEAFNFGLSDRSGTVEFYYAPECSVRASAARLAEDDNSMKIKCAVRTLDAFVAEKNVCVDFIKCDVEGAELLVLRGGRNTIDAYRPVIFAEMLRKWSAKFNYHPNDIIALLSDLGYRCFSLRGSELARIDDVNEDTEETNFFFLHVEKHEARLRSIS